MNQPINVFLFSGQGTQYPSMGRQLSGSGKVFKSRLQTMDDLAGDHLGFSVLDHLATAAREPLKPFDRTLVTHTAIFMLELAAADELREAGVEPGITLGTSLGTFAAATVAGMISPGDALAAVIRQARIIEQTCVRGAMVAILGDTTVLERPPFRAMALDVAAYNFVGSFVVSAPEFQVNELLSALKTNAIPAQRLPVSHAFHSRWIDPASGYRDYLQGLPRPQGRIPLACCANVALTDRLTNTQLWDVVRKPVRFQQMIDALDAHEGRTYRFIDLGPGASLATCMNYIGESGKRHTGKLFNRMREEMDNLRGIVNMVSPMEGK